jgi:hypothetical protein
MPTTAENLARWHQHLQTHSHQDLWDMLHPDAVFESPVVHTPQVGRAIVFKYLASAGEVLGGEGFTYVGEWLNERSAILEFTNTVRGIKVNGIDMISWDENGLITHFKVMVRPLKAINLMHQMMGEMLEKMASQPG